MIIRVHKRINPYVIIDKTCLNDKRLSWKAKGLLAYLLSKPDDWKLMVGALEQCGPDGESAIRSGLKELEKAGYIKKRAIRDEATGKFKEWEHIVYETPYSDNPDVENPDVDNPDVDKPHVDNRALLINDTTKYRHVLSNESTKGSCQDLHPDSPPSPVKRIFDHWNSKKIIQHRKLTDKLKRSIRGALKDYSEEEICRAIDNYERILHGPQYFWSYKWTLKDFLQRGLEKFLDWKVCSVNYLKERKPRGEPGPTKRPKKYADIYE